MSKTKREPLSLKSCYQKLTYDEVSEDHLKHTDTIRLGRKGKNFDHVKEYLTICAGFDIETTKITTEEGAFSYMYIWQLAYNDYIIIGRTWNQFEELIQRIISINNLSENRRMIIWDANLGFEFAFLCKHFEISNLFAKTSRHPLSYLINECIEFRDALAITNSSLAELAKMYCTTKKMVGDLDYTLIRNSKTILTDEEMKYCINDVRILAEFALVMFNEYIIPKKYIPITASNLTRHKIKSKIKNKKKLKYAIGSAFPAYDEYELMTNYLYRGGVSHSNAPFVDMVIEDSNIEIRDFTSSYPSEMLNSYAPMGRFKTGIKDFHTYLDTYCCKILIKFKNITSTTTHSLESKNKIIYYSKDAIFDNGRLHSASEILVYLTELDYFNYKEFYTWKTENCIKCEIATRGYLPEYITKCIAEDYILKHDLKEKYKSLGIDPDSQPDYVRAKRAINTYYGVCCTKMHMMQDNWDPVQGWTCIRNFDFVKEVEKAFLLPQWGIWVTSWGRYHLMQSIAAITKAAGNCILQYDTDSIILLRSRATDKFFDQYNDNIYRRNAATCDRLRIPYEIFYNIGEFDVKCHPVKIKCLGAKRYIYTKADGHIVPTIAGLPKKAFEDYIKKGGDAYEKFSNRMHYDMESSLKLRVSYQDNETSHEVMDYQGHLETMHELSSCSLVETDFTMSLTDEFVAYYSLYHERYRRDTI